MARIKVTDLPKDQEIRPEEMKQIAGGYRRVWTMDSLTNPWILGSIVATAIAVPLAINDSDDGS